MWYQALRRKTEPLSVGASISNRYQVIRQIAEGGFGAVYEVQHIQLKKRFALKVLNDRVSKESAMIERLKREAIATSQINHPNIVSVTDFGTTSGGQVYLVMELLEGQNLAEVLRTQRTVRISRAIPILASLCHALEAAHQIGIVHRDLKPENIFLIQHEDAQSGVKRDFVKILDFGLAKLVEGRSTSRLSSEGMAVGTPGYMAPEALRGKEVDHRADIYSLGCIAFEMFAGRQVFTGAPMAVALAHDQEIPPRVSACPSAVRVPEQMERLIERCLQKDPARRFSSCKEMLDNLRILANELISPEGRTRAQLLLSPSSSETRRWWEDLSFSDLPVGMPSDRTPAFGSWSVEDSGSGGGDPEEGVTVRRDFSEVLEGERRVASREVPVLAEPFPLQVSDSAETGETVLAQNALAEEAHETALPERPAPRRLLLVEEDEVFAARLEQELAGRGWIVHVEAEGKRALDSIRDQQPDAVLVCVELASSNGYFVCNRLKSDEDLRRIPLILMSAVATEETWSQHRRLATRADGYLCKPFDSEELARQLDVVMDPAHRTAVAPPRSSARPARAAVTKTKAAPGRSARWRWAVIVGLVVAGVGGALAATFALRPAEADTGALLLHLSPPSASVQIEGGVVWRGGDGPLVLNGLPARPTRLTVSHPSCTPLVKDVAISRGKVLELHLALSCPSR
jgi:serine/threonine protein kinase/CheY-like chemotaxis protein